MFLLVVARIVLVNTTLRQEIDTRLRVERELRRAKEEADVASKAKSEFLANMSHEIRTPMNAVIGFGELLRSTPLDEQQRDYVETIADSGELLISLISDILDLSKIEARTLTLEAIDFDLEYLIASVFRILRHRAQSKSLTLTLQMPDDMPRTFKGDPTRIRQVIMNLVGNAIKFTATGGITIGVRQDPDAPVGVARLEFSVKDTGIGIPVEKQRAIFDAFTQVDSSTTREYGGTGLGLTITRSLVEMMGGTIRVNSKLGRGTEFLFDLRLQPGESNIDKDIAPVDVDDLAGKKVLIVDDNEQNRAILGRYCQDVRMEVMFSAESVQQALDWLTEARRDIDIVFTDIRMPGIDGYSFARQVKADDRLRHVKLIALTSDALPGSAEYSNRVGFDAFLPKPFRRRDVYEILRAVFGDKRGTKHQIITKHLAHELLTKGISVLLVEDNHLNQKLMTVLLDKLGCVVEIANNGREAVERTASHTYDVVLMDLQMPVMDGFEATEIIRRQNGSPVPIVALTARAFKDDEEQCRAVGMNDFLTKPIDARALRETLFKWARP
jgi:signal transduction histidine kinase/DNA-binding response OmpR family regulator